MARSDILLIKKYAKVFKTLGDYDSGKLKLVKTGKPKFILTYQEAKKVIDEARKELKKMGISVGAFGKEINGKLETIIISLYQTFGKKELYPSIGEKAVNLLYFILKKIVIRLDRLYNRLIDNTVLLKLWYIEVKLLSKQSKIHIL